jgi:hypothetical protein
VAISIGALVEAGADAEPLAFAISAPLERWCRAAARFARRAEGFEVLDDATEASNSATCASGALTSTLRSEKTPSQSLVLARRLVSPDRGEPVTMLASARRRRRTTHSGRLSPDSLMSSWSSSCRSCERHGKSG